MKFLNLILNMPVSDRSDEETGELVKEWLRRYFPTIVSGVFIALVVIFAMNWWRDKQQQKTLALSHQVEVLQAAVSSQDKMAAEKVYLDELAEVKTANGYLAALLMGKLYADEGNYEQAKQALEKASQSKDGLVVQTAQWQLANVYVSQKQYEQALNILQNLRNSAFSSQASRLEGDVYYLQGKLNLAVAAYEESQLVIPSPLLETSINQLKARLALQDKAVEE